MQKYELSFKGQNIFVGIDVHLKTWSVTVLSASGLKRQFTQPSDSRSLFDHLRKNYPEGSYHAVYESGFCGYSTCYELRSLGVDCIIVNASDVPLTQKDRLSKTDPADSLRLARSLREGSLSGIYVPDPVMLDDRGVVRHREMIIKDMSRCKSRIKHLLYTNGVKYPNQFQRSRQHWTRSFIMWLENEVRLLGSTRMSLDLLIEELHSYRHMLLKSTGAVRELSRAERYRERFNRLVSIPGVGLITAMTLLTETFEGNRFSSVKKFVSYLGLVPVMRNSGEFVRQGELTPRGNQHIRRMLIESAWVSIRCDAELSSAFGHYCQYMKKAQAIVRIAKKLASRICHILKTNEYYKCR